MATAGREGGREGGTTISTSCESTGPIIILFKALTLDQYSKHCQVSPAFPHFGEMKSERGDQLQGRECDQD